MTKNWTSVLTLQSQIPSTLEDAVTQLLMILDNEQKSELTSMKEEELFDLHFTLGLAIRNAFKLHQLDSPLHFACATIHPDDASSVILTKLWQVLQLKA